MSEIRCATCGKTHDALPMVWGPDFPCDADPLLSGDSGARVTLSNDACVIDGERYFVRASLDLPIRGEEAAFRWLVWAEVPKPAFSEVRSFWRQLTRRTFAPVEGKLAVALPYDASTAGVPIELHDGGTGFRPRAIVLDGAHPLAREQREGLSFEAAVEKAGQALHALA